MELKRYKAKPCKVGAVMLTNETIVEIRNMLDDAVIVDIGDKKHLKLEFRQGGTRIEATCGEHWIVKGIDDDKYHVISCEDFEKRYIEV